MNLNKFINDLSLFLGFFLLHIAGNTEGNIIGLLIFAVFFIFLFLRSSVYSFIFAYILHINVMGSFGFPLMSTLTLVGMLVIIFRKKDYIVILKENKQIKSLAIISVIFFIYIAFVNLLGKGVSIATTIKYAGFYAGFLVFLPAYCLSFRHKNDLFRIFVLTSAVFLIVYYLNILLGQNWIKINESTRGEDIDLELTRLMYDIRQFVIFFAYLLPAVFFITISRAKKIILVLVGVFAYLVLVMALYRLAMFYVIMGAFTCLFFISKYISLSKLFSRLIIATFVLFIVFSLFSSSLEKYVDIYQWTAGYFSGSSSDASADARFLFQMPVLTELFTESPLTGAGLETLLGYEKEGMFGYVDFPILGTLAAFGIIGMIIYYYRFILILPLRFGSQLSKSSLFEKYGNDILILLALKAYFITMITYRLFYISWELTFSYQQIEFGLFVGVYFALQNAIKKCEQEDIVLYYTG